MITSEKISIFKQYKGYFDGYYVQNKDKTMIITDDEWFLIDNLIQDLSLIRNGLCSELYKKQTVEKIKANCDNAETFELLFELEN